MGDNSVGGRIPALDGLRGWAALSVVTFHFTWETFGARFPSLRMIWTAFLANDHLAVAIFFVLSGYVLTRGRWGRPSGGLMAALLARYLRLALPILVTALLTMAIIEFGVNNNVAAGKIVGRTDWLGRFLSFQPDVLGAFYFSTVRVFLFNDRTGYGPFLWTMMVELTGSFLVLTLSQFRPRAWQAIILGVISLVLLRVFSIGVGLPIGALIALADSSRGIAPSPRAPVVVGGVLLAVVLAALVKVVDGPQALIVACATAIVYLARTDNVLSAFLRGPLSQWLGELSFPIYLAQFAVLVTLTSDLIVVSDSLGTLDFGGAVAIAVISVALTLALAYVFLPVEAATLQLTRLVRKFRLGHAVPVKLR